MLPQGNEVSTTAVVAGFSYPVKTPLPVDKLQDWELAGVALNDASQGLLVKVWHCTLEVDRDTSVGSVYVEAPGVAKTLLFSGVGVTEVAVAFDQNMNPFVAYMQGTDAKIFWYDPLAPGMVHTTLPAGCYDLRCCLDEKRAYFVGVSDIVLSYIRAGNLCIRYQRDRYLVEYVLKAGVGPDAKLVSMAMNNGFRLQWRLRNYVLTDDPNTLIQVNPYLADVVYDLGRKAGWKPENIDVSDLYEDEVSGLRVDSDEGLAEPIEQLAKVFFFDKSEHDKKVFFPKRGRDVVARIPYNDLVRGNPTALKQQIVDENELAREVHVNHIDPDGGFAKNKQFALRRSNMVHAQEKRNVSTQVVLTVDQAATTADALLRLEWNEQLSYEFSTTIKWTELTVGDVVEVEDKKGTWHRMRLEERNEDGTIEWKGKQDAGQRTYGKTFTGNALPPPISTTPGLIGETLIEILTIPVQRDQDDELGLYIAATGTSSAWTGYQMLVSTDGGTSFVEAYRAETPCTIGETVTDLLEITGYEYQGTQTVEVTSNFPLASITDAQLLVNQNRIIIGDEVLQFKTATLLGMVGTLYHYRLSGLLRGRYATATPTWPAGARFVLFDEAVVFAQAQRAMLGMDLEYKPVSFGVTEDETVSTMYLFDEAASQTEWPVDAVAAARDGSDNVTVSWIGVARLGLDTSPFHSKYFTGYRVKFSNGHTIDTTDQTATYSAAPVAITVQVCALNEITGEGPYSTAIAT
jgi:hypothetical protein